MFLFLLAKLTEPLFQSSPNASAKLLFHWLATFGEQRFCAVDLFADILSRLSSGTGSVGISRGSYFEKSLYQASCKAAMKGGRMDGDEDMKYIVDTLLSNPKIRYCPHGRPVMFELTQSTIEHKFKRT